MTVREQVDLTALFIRDPLAEAQYRDQQRQEEYLRKGGSLLIPFFDRLIEQRKKATKSGLVAVRSGKIWRASGN